MRSTLRTTTSPLEAFSIAMICFGLAIYSSIQAVSAGFNSGAFTDANLYSIIVMELILGAIAFLVLYIRGFAISTLYPAPSLVGVAVGIATYVATLVAVWVLTAPFVSSQGAQPIDSMVSHASVSLSTVVLVALINGAYEEIFLLGFLLCGLRGYGLSIAMGVSLLVRVLYHLYQGPLGAISILAFGLVLSLNYVRTGSLFSAVFAHILADIIPFL
ncbi:CPBP family intramembrane metalloprotease [Collimonas pratensis]|uniref:CPBP family intramembrane glutamic endopeptidase n=1 Tax=Collimonas pratensis TaxID=279113 RepID=UPI00143DC8CD|nr:CPBP family intramembrane glutamic endopeptidase [Collimonas pratensis]NKI70834.1 CPBP family intramembrane metalloprotease [Collimonas pratensis]